MVDDDLNCYPIAPETASAFGIVGVGNALLRKGVLCPAPAVVTEAAWQLFLKG